MANEKLAARYDIGMNYLDSDDRREQRHGVEIIGELAIDDYGPAQETLGELYRMGNHVPQNEKKALYWLDQAVQNGQVSALVEIGKVYLYNDADDAKAVSFVREAAGKGDWNGELCLGDCYYYGYGIEEDEFEAAKWYRKAAEQGQPYAQFNLGRMLLRGEGPRQDEGEGIQLITEAAEYGRADAQDFLGDYYNYRKNDADKAVDWYLKAAKQGVANAQTELGLLCHSGEGVKQDDELAVQCFTDAADQGDARAMYYLSQCYMNGVGVAEDFDKGWDLLTKAADKGNINALNDLGDRYMSAADDDETSKKDQAEFYETAAQCFMDAAKQDDARAIWRLGWMHIRGQYFATNEKEGFALFMKAAKDDFSPAQVAVGICYVEGIGVERNKNEAIYWYKRAADQGNEEAVKYLEDISPSDAAYYKRRR